MRLFKRSSSEFVSFLCLSLVVATIFVSAIGPRPASADPFWMSMITTNHIETDPNGDYSLKREHGPWLIMACTFSGDVAEDQARELVLELRRKHRLPAYHHVMDFDFSDDTQSEGQRLQRLRYQHEERREIAVLIGDFSAVDDPRAQKTLEAIKHLEPAALDVESRGGTNQNLAVLRAFQKAIKPKGDKSGTMGPMSKAFVTRNPMIPKEYFVNPGVDELVEWMNDGVPNSLLQCPGNFTVQVATFTGQITLDQNKVRQYEQTGKASDSKLEKAAYDAHNLTVLLRDKGYEAYVFHDRYSSIVTVGSFATVGIPRQDGKIELDPKILLIMKTFQGEPISANVPGALPGYRVKSVGANKIPLDIQPQIVPVPRRSFSAMAARR